MRNTRAAKRYAGALLGLSVELKKTEQVAVDMVMIHDSVRSSHELKTFLASPVIDRGKKGMRLKHFSKGRWMS